MQNWIVSKKTVFDIEIVLILNWIVWNGTVFWLWNRVLMLNWIVWNKTVYMYKNGFCMKWPTMVDMQKNER